MEKESATIHIQTRLTPSEYKPFKNVIENFDIKKAELFRKIILSNEKNMVEVSGSAQETDAQKRMIFLANKASNNINQIAKKLNQAYRGEVVSERNYLKIMNELIGVRSAFENGMDKC
ncbi:plasmid mobilization relaxosome protein MobC [Vibrio hyugaensis]|uniref:plasmid mobilization relaxosome protein MobC n=1 Tax=Vibrio hyugaensis TaxID=1534743 RepID=UPI000CE51B04|nr:plasmid mobilization relaxosome protein MobC [Vibrio hyugaensis]